jgi:hypothetical protein
MALGATTYSSVTWTTGDVITEAKLDAMVANDQAHDSHAANGLSLNNNTGFYMKDSGGTARACVNVDASNNLVIGDGTNFNEVQVKVMSKCKAYLSGSQNNIADDTNVKVTLNAETYDIGGDFDTSNNRFTAPVTGYYLVTAGVAFSSVIADKNYYGMIYVNGAAYVYMGVQQPGGAGTSTLQLNGSAVCAVTAGQYVEEYVYLSVGASTVDLIASPAYTYMCVHLLSA